jgi:hypothetical protein
MEDRRRDYVLWTSMLGLGRCCRTPKLATEVEAEASASRWLRLVDDGRVDESWEEAASQLRGAITGEEWERALSAVRKPLGRCLARRLEELERVEASPGAPRGPHVVTRFETRFEAGSVKHETVTSTLGADRRWRVSGYFVG